ncbi:MAG: chloride channel protein, partial [Alphaproteobacteria bacterium]
MWLGWPRRAYTALRRLVRSDQLLLLVLAVTIGVTAALGAIVFRLLIGVFQGLSFGTTGDVLYQHAATLPAWQILLVPTAGGLVIGLFVHFFMPGRRPQGVSDVIEAAALRSGRMGVRAGLGGALVSAASIGCGASVGREGPVVHLGASISSWVARRLGLGRLQAVTILGCGVASAVAASFNAPIAGVFFALEVVIGHYALNAFAPIVIASVTGTIVSRIQFGDFPAFIIPSHSISSALEFPAFAILGVLCAASAVLLMRSIGVVQTSAETIRLPPWSRPMVGGLLVGLIALVFPQVLGVGYGTTDAALKELLPLALVIALIAAKTTAVAISIGSGFGGGVFSPSLFIGAMVCAGFGMIATSVFPELSSGHGAYTLVGMGAVAGAVLGAPISTILIIFERTGDYTVSMAVMVAVVIASVITQQVHRRSFFTWQLEQRGLNLSGGREAGLLSDLKISDVMKREFTSVPPSMHLHEMREVLQAAPHALLFVVNDDGTLHGTVTLADLADAAFDTSMDALINAADVARTHP